MKKTLCATTLVALTLIATGCSGLSPQASLLPSNAATASSDTVGKSNVHTAIVGVTNATNIYISSVNDVGANEILVYSAGSMAYLYPIRMPSDYRASSGEFAVAKDDNKADIDIYYANPAAGTLDVCVAGPARVVVKGGVPTANCVIKGLISNPETLINPQPLGTVDVVLNGQLGALDVLNNAASMERFPLAAFSDPSSNPSIGNDNWVGHSLKLAVVPGVNGFASIADTVSGDFWVMNSAFQTLTSSPLPSKGVSAVAYDINAAGQSWYADSNGTLSATTSNGFQMVVPNAINSADVFDIGLATDDSFAYVYNPVAGTVTYYKDGAILASGAVAATMSVPAWSGPGAITIL